MQRMEEMATRTCMYKGQGWTGEIPRGGQGKGRTPQRSLWMHCQRSGCEEDPHKAIPITSGE